MTNKEAIDFIKTDISRLWNTPQNFLHKEALEMAIKALEKEPCDNAISRQALLDGIADLKKSPWFNENINGAKVIRKEAVEIVEALCVNSLPFVNPQEPKTDVLDKIRAEIDEQYDRVHPYNISCAEGLEMALEIIDKYKAESEEV